MSFSLRSKMTHSFKKIANSFHVIIFLALSFIFRLSLSSNYGPPLPRKVFTPVWNSPTLSCKNHWNVSLPNLEEHGIVVNDKHMWFGEFMNILYSNQTGLWPFYDEETPVNGGLPQVFHEKNCFLIGRHNAISYKALKEGFKALLLYH